MKLLNTVSSGYLLQVKWGKTRQFITLTSTPGCVILPWKTNQTHILLFSLVLTIQQPENSRIVSTESRPTTTHDVLGGWFCQISYYNNIFPFQWEMKLLSWSSTASIFYCLSGTEITNREIWTSQIQGIQ